MNQRQQTFQFENAYAEAFQFDTGTAVQEYHVMIHVNSSRLPYTTQLEAVMNAYNSLIEGPMKGAQAVFKRYFLSDAANQADEIIVSDVTDCAKSIIQQAPLDGTKVALWVYLMTDVQTGLSRMSIADSWKAVSMRSTTELTDTSGMLPHIIPPRILSIRHACSSTSITCSSSRKDVRWKPTVSAPGFSSTTWT